MTRGRRSGWRQAGRRVNLLAHWHQVVLRPHKQRPRVVGEAKPAAVGSKLSFQRHYVQSELHNNIREGLALFALVLAHGFVSHAWLAQYTNARTMSGSTASVKQKLFVWTIAPTSRCLRPQHRQLEVDHLPQGHLLVANQCLCPRHQAPLRSAQLRTFPRGQVGSKVSSPLR